MRVVEVDRERGRIGLRLAEDPEIAGKSVEELAGVGSGGGGRRAATAATADRAVTAAAAAAADRDGGRGGDRGPRGDRDRPLRAPTAIPDRG